MFAVGIALIVEVDEPSHDSLSEPFARIVFPTKSTESADPEPVNVATLDHAEPVQYFHAVPTTVCKNEFVLLPKW
jgi:hypothetical protein